MNTIDLYSLDPIGETDLHFADEDIREALLRRITAPPRSGTPATELTEREKLALAIAVGAPYEISEALGRLNIRTKVPVGFADRPGGGYFVAISKRQA